MKSTKKTDVKETNTSMKSKSSSIFSIGTIGVVLVAIILSLITFTYPNEANQLQQRFVMYTKQMTGIDISMTLKSFTKGSTYERDCLKLLEPHITKGELPVKGFHVLCLQELPETSDLVKITAIRNGIGAPLHAVNASVHFFKMMGTLDDYLQIPIPEGDAAHKYKQPPAFFTPTGDRIETSIVTTELLEKTNGILYLFEGGQFIWPGIEIGHITHLPGLPGLKGSAEMKTLSLNPLVFSIDEFLTDEEIKIVLDLSVPFLAPSGVAHNDADKGRPATDWRTSTTYFLPTNNHPALQVIDERVQELTKVPKSHQEDVQVLRYEKTQKYDHHTDYFEVQNHRSDPHFIRSLDYGYKNRMITVFWYMSDVAKGGHTVFPRAGAAPYPDSMKDCTKGLKVAPKKRKVIVFYSMLPNGEGDPFSLHGGCPVEEGVKYSGNKWVWNKPRV